MNYEKLLKLQAALKNPPLDGVAKMGAYSYKYATLPSILDYVRTVATSCGLVVLQDVSCSNGTVGVCTIIADPESKERFELGHIEAVVPAEQRMNAIQAMGSVITYLRRYSLLATLGLAGEEDTDTAEIQPAKQEQEPKHETKKTYINIDEAIKKLNNCKNIEELKNTFIVLREKINPDDMAKFIEAKDLAKASLAFDDAAGEVVRIGRLNNENNKQS